jgi:hypothetical protein
MGEIIRQLREASARPVLIGAPEEGRGERLLNVRVECLIPDPATLPVVEDTRHCVQVFASGKEWWTGLRTTVRRMSILNGIHEDARIAHARFQKAGVSISPASE